MITPTTEFGKERDLNAKIRKAIAAAQADQAALATADATERWQIMDRMSLRIVRLMQLIARTYE